MPSNSGKFTIQFCFTEIYDFAYLQKSNSILFTTFPYHLIYGFFVQFNSAKFQSYFSPGILPQPDSPPVHYQADNLVSVQLEQAIDDLLIFVGIASEVSSGPYGGIATVNTLPGSPLNAERLLTTSPGDLSIYPDFEPFAGSIVFNGAVITAEPGSVLGIAIHEIGHVLGIGQAPDFAGQSFSGSFDGPTVRAVSRQDWFTQRSNQAGGTGGQPVPGQKHSLHFWRERRFGWTAGRSTKQEHEKCSDAAAGKDPADGIKALPQAAF
jgi:hypothetical protein